MFKKILFALLIGLIGAVAYVQNDPWVHDYIAKNFKEIFEQSYNCSIDFKVNHVNLFVPRVEFGEVKVRPKNLSCSTDKSVDQNSLAGQGGWGWQAQTMTLHVSWLSLLGGMLGLHIDLDDVHARSSMADGRISLWQEHISKLVEGPSTTLPIFLKSLVFRNAQIHVKDNATLDCMLHVDSESKKINEFFKSNIHIHNGSLALYEKPIFDHLSGSLNLDASYFPDGVSLSSKAYCSADMAALPENKRTCYISGSWMHDHGEYTIKSADQTLSVDPIKVSCPNNALCIDAQSQMPIQSLLGFIDGNSRDMALTGSCNLAMHAEFNPMLHAMAGECSINNMQYKSLPVFDLATCTFEKKQDNRISFWQGALSLIRSPMVAMQGSWQWREDSQGKLTLLNDKACPIPFTSFKIEPHDLAMHIDIHSDLKTSGSYTCLARNEFNESHNLDGAFTFAKNMLTCKGHINRNAYNFSADVSSKPRLKTLNYIDDQGNSLISLAARQDDLNLFDAAVKFSLMRLLVQHFFNYHMQGEGTFKIAGKIADEHMELGTKLEQGTIRLPETYNFINGFDAELLLDWMRKKITLKKLQCTLNRGSCASEHGVAQFNDHGSMTYAFLPLTFDSCLFNFKKDLFIMLSGALNLTKKENTLPELKGHLFVERSQLKENIFSDQFQRNLFAYTSSFLPSSTTINNMLVDVSVETKHAVKIETAFCQAAAKVGIHIQNSLLDPNVSGFVDILSGNLQFPYRPLQITKGRIYFMPQQLYDPMIELSAKSKIKKYTVNLHITGSLLNHDISLESSPPLSEAQIIALLLVGAPEESLSTMAPALIMQNLKTVFFEDHSPLKIDAYFKDWLKPFKNIHLVPSFTDQTARGGLRGAIEIDFSDRFRASATKNFSLTEDTRFELEYQLSDDVTVRGIRDERKDVGGEVEMRWKFGG